MNGHSQRPRPGVLRSPDVPISLHIADLRPEIDGIKELNMIYWAQKVHTYLDQAAHERRKVRLEEIMRELTALGPKRD
jgi:hypothetical protein